MFKVGLCGKIGSGKSTVCRAFERLGIAVYISDDHAKALMQSCEELKSAIVEVFGDGCYIEGTLNREYLASQIFGSKERRETLNSIVHPAVCRHFVEWAEHQTSKYVIVESAILFESGLDSVVDAVIGVIAPENLCLERAAKRDGAEAEAILARMRCQITDSKLIELSDYIIRNTTLDDLERQVVDIDSKICQRI